MVLVVLFCGGVGSGFDTSFGSFRPVSVRFLVSDWYRVRGVWRLDLRVRHHVWKFSTAFVGVRSSNYRFFLNAGEQSLHGVFGDPTTLYLPYSF